MAQRTSAPAAHRAAREAASEVAFHAAMATGDAAASAYLRPLADSAQVKHILSGPAHAVRAIELTEPLDGGSTRDRLVQRFTYCATSQFSEVLRRYPRIGAVSGPSSTRPTPTCEKPNRKSDRTSQINRLMAELDERLRNPAGQIAEQP